MINKIFFIGCGAVGYALLEIFKKEKLYYGCFFCIIEPKKIVDLDYVMAKRDYKHIQEPLTRENHLELLQLVDDKTFIINVSINVDSIMILKVAKERGAHYIDTSLEQYQDFIRVPIDKITKYSQFKKNNLFHQNLEAEKLLKNSKKTRLLSAGMNPGCCNNYVKRILNEYAKYYGKELVNGNYAKLASECGLMEIQIVEFDSQKLKTKATPKRFISTWSAWGLYEEGTDLCLLSLNNKDIADLTEQGYKLIKPTEGNKNTHIRFIPEMGMNISRKSKTLNDKGDIFEYTGMLIPHAETITLSEFLSYNGDAPTIMYIYHPSEEAYKSLEYVRQNDYKMLDDEYVVRNKDIISGWDSVCCLLKFKSGDEWIGGTILGKQDVNKMKFKSGATVIQVASFMNACIKWILENPNEGVIQAENVPNAYIWEHAEKYLGLSVVKKL